MTNSEITVSVVVPVFNEAKNLDELASRCLASCEETKLPFEIILIDDGSIDDSRNMIASLAEAHTGKVIGVFLNRNYGQHAAIMAGFSQISTLPLATMKSASEESFSSIKTISLGRVADSVISAILSSCSSVKLSNRSVCAR